MDSIALYLYAIPLFLLTMIVEWRVVRRAAGTRGYTVRDTAASLSMGIGYLVVAGAAAVVTVPIYAWFSAWAPWNLGGRWWTWPLLFVAEDLCFYAYHRASHEVRLFWASHVNHHSSRHYNLSTALRQSWTAPLTGWVFWVPLLLVGFPVELVLLQKGVSLLYQYWIHTETIGRLGPLEWVLNTPSHHRVHHARNPRYLDRNHGGILIVWDRLFGTFEEEDEPAVYGLVHDIEGHNPAWIAFHEWVALVRDVVRWPAHALSLLIRPPGWSPNGDGETTGALRRALSDPPPAP